MASVDSEPAAAPSSPPSRLRKGWLVGLVAVAVLLADQLSKAWAVSRLSGYRQIHLIWTIDFQLAFNQGMAFSRAQGMGKVIAVAALVIIVVLAWFARTIDNKWQLICIGVVMGGAAGNLSDRIFRAGTGFLGGRVVDFINPNWWPVFNVSDSAIVVGGIALALLLSFEKAPPTPENSSGPDAPVSPGAGSAVDAQVSDEAG